MSTRITSMLFLAVCWALSGAVVAAPLSYVGTSPLVPPADGVYLHPGNVHTIYSGGALTIVLERAEHRGFSQIERTPNGAGTLENFHSDVGGEVSINGGPLTPVTLSGQVMVQVGDGYTPGSFGTFNTEMLALDLIGGGGVRIRESPTLASTGQTTIQALGGGLFQITSFFDIFTELSLDGGQNWIPSTGSTHMELTNVPEPSTWVLMGSALALGAVLRRRLGRQRV